LVQNIGWGFRLQGPIGNRDGSMMSEHMTAGWPMAASVPAKGIPVDSVLFWHRNLPAGTPFQAGQVSLDYNLELVAGMRNLAIENGDSVMLEEHINALTESLGFRPKLGGDSKIDEEEEVIEYDQGLTGRNVFVFIGFIILVLVLAGLLVWNFMRK
jgi:hypothetical protein